MKQKCPMPERPGPSPEERGEPRHRPIEFDEAPEISDAGKLRVIEYFVSEYPTDSITKRIRESQKGWLKDREIDVAAFYPQVAEIFARRGRREVIRMELERDKEDA